MAWRDWLWRPRGLRPLDGVEVLPGGKVIGDARLAATADDVVLADVQFLHGEAAPESHWVMRRRRFRRPCRLSGTALLLAVASGHNFYHWLIESLPRSQMAEEAGWPVERFDHVLVNELLEPFHHETLARLGVRPEQIRRCRKRQVCQVECLVVPPVPGPPEAPGPWVVGFLRQRLGPASPPPAGRRLFLSRARINRRHLVNEAEILAVLAPLGFEVFRPEEHSFADQAAAFAGAECIVGVHGAAFSHVVFAPEGAVVVELMPPGYENPCFAHLARVAKLRFHRLPSQPAGRLSPHPTQRDLRVEPAQLQRFLAQAGIAPV